MASDEDYAAFLEKSNEDPSKGVAKSKQKKSEDVQLNAVDDGVEVPISLKEATSDAFYVSDADEPFEVVYLSGAGKKLPDEKKFAQLVNHPDPTSAQVEILNVGAWDPQGQYKDVVDAVRKEAKGGDVKVYRIVRKGARVEYFVVGVEGGKLIGVRTLAVES